MRKNKKQKIIIIALCISVLGLTLGFAAFSNMLTISSSATVSPDRDDFKITIYGNGIPDNFEDFDSVTESFPSVASSLKSIVIAGPSKIDNNNLTISIDDFQINGEHGIATYWYVVVNEGKYNAYITQEDFPKDDIISKGIVCAPIDENVSEELLSKACENADITISLVNEDAHLDSDENYSIGNYIELGPGEEALLEIRIGSPSEGNNKIQADGKYSISFPDVKLNFTTVKPEN